MAIIIFINGRVIKRAAEHKKKHVLCDKMFSGDVDKVSQGIT